MVKDVSSIDEIYDKLLFDSMNFGSWFAHWSLRKYSVVAGWRIWGNSGRILFFHVFFLILLTDGSARSYFSHSTDDRIMYLAVAHGGMDIAR